MSVIVAVGQMCSQADKALNLNKIETLINKARARGAALLCLPENCVFLGSKELSFEAREPLHGPTIQRIKELAYEYSLWISLGGFQEISLEDNKIYNTQLLISSEGELAGVYRKIHLFSVNLPDGSLYREESQVIPGDKLSCIETPFFKVGLSICYDVRFSYLFWALRNAGAEVILVPAAFTDITGKAHWEVLLRARAIETQSYVIAAAQYGLHNGERKTHGHSMIIDPWGTVLAQCGDNSDIAVAEIDMEYLAHIRKNMPIIEQQKIIHEL